MGRRFTGPEREQIQKLVSEGLTSREIAERLGRTEAAVRNIRYREGLKTETARARMRYWLGRFIRPL